MRKGGRPRRGAAGAIPFFILFVATALAAQEEAKAMAEAAALFLVFKLADQASLSLAGPDLDPGDAESKNHFLFGVRAFQAEVEYGGQ